MSGTRVVLLHACLFSPASLDVVPLECGRLLLPGQATPRGCAGCVLNWDSLPRLQ